MKNALRTQIERRTPPDLKPRERERKTLYYGRRMMKHGHHQRLDASAHQHLSRHLRSCWSMWRLVSTSFLVRQTTTTIYLDCVGLWYRSYKVFRVLLEGFMSCDKNAFKCGSQSIKLVDFKVINNGVVSWSIFRYSKLKATTDYFYPFLRFLSTKLSIQMPIIYISWLRVEITNILLTFTF